MKSDDKDFIISLDDETNKLRYICDGSTGNGCCWGKYMIIYTKAGVIELVYAILSTENESVNSFLFPAVTLGR